MLIWWQFCSDIVDPMSSVMGLTKSLENQSGILGQSLNLKRIPVVLWKLHFDYLY